MAKKQTFGQKSRKEETTESQLKVIFSQKNEDKGSYSFREKIISVPEGKDLSQAANEALK